MFKQIDAFYKTRVGYLVFGLVELGIAYAAISWAIDSGSLLAYLVTLVFLVGALQNLFKCVVGFEPKQKSRRG